VSKRQSNNPKRRIAKPGSISETKLTAWSDSLAYVGSALHKRKPGDYGFRPPINPRPSKSLCDDVRALPRAEARRLFEEGIRKGVVSEPPSDEAHPKYVWSVDDDREVYEAKLGNDGYHGYRLDREDEKVMRQYVLDEWDRR